MQPGLFIEVLVLQSERLVRVLVNPLILFQTTPGGVFAVPEEIAVLAQDADLVAVEVMGLLSDFSFCACPIADLRQRFVGVLVGIDIGIPTVQVDFLQEVAAFPNESGFLFEVI